MGFRWSKRSLRELEGIDPDLRKVCDLALKLTPIDFIITDGKRTIEEQRHYVKIGASKTMNSRHLKGDAIDFVALIPDTSGKKKVSYRFEAMKKIAGAFKKAAKQLDIPIEWGGDWKSFKDTPHIQLAKRKKK